MSVRDQGFEDFFHYNVPRQPDNEEYMVGWNAGREEEPAIMQEHEDEWNDNHYENDDYDDYDDDYYDDDLD